MNWRIIACVLYLVGTLNMTAGMYIFTGAFSTRTIVLSSLWPAYPAFAIFWNVEQAILK